MKERIHMLDFTKIKVLCSLKNSVKPGMVGHICNSSCSWQRQEDHGPILYTSAIPYLKNKPKPKRLGLWPKWLALNLIPSTAKQTNSSLKRIKRKAIDWKKIIAKDI
jgi:hypothetical protein